MRKYAFILTLVGGIMLLIWGLMGAWNLPVGLSLAHLSFGNTLLGLPLWVGGEAVIWGALSQNAAYLTVTKPKVAGIEAIIYGIVNIVAGFDLFFVWSIIIIIGGILAYKSR